MQDVGENIYTLPEVVEEIKDAATRSRLQFTPYEIKYREPSAENLKTIIDFSRKTGDYHQLSITDLKLMALTYQLEKEFNGIEHLRTEPVKATVTSSSKVVGLTKPLPGFYIEKNSDKITTENEKQDNDSDLSLEDECRRERDNKETFEKGEEISKSEENNEEGWITPSNIEQIRKEIQNMKVEEEENQTTVGCMTGDFAIQNVLLQIGLKVINIEDRLCIKTTKQFVFRCYACFKIATKITSKNFCPSCGNLNTLKRVAVTVNADGSKTVHINFKKPINVRGTKYSLPQPKGGKHAVNPVLVADQPLPQQKSSKFAYFEKQKTKIDKVLSDPDYVIRSNPFAINDVYSKSSRFSTHVPNAKNPNASRRPTGNKKKRNP